MDEGLTNPGHYSMPLGKNGKNNCHRIGHCKKKFCRLMDATRRAQGVQWHPGKRPVVKFNGHVGSLVN